MKKVLAVMLALVLCLSAACALAADKIGVSFPSQSQPRWEKDGTYMKAMLEEARFEADLQYANDDAATQISQLEAMIAGGCKVLVVAPVDDSALATVLAKAKAQNIPVIAYDRLIMDTDAVSYYITYDNYVAGTFQGKYIEALLDLENAAGPFNMEIIGNSEDYNSIYIYKGIMDILKPYMDSGKLFIPSGQKDFETVALPGTSTDVAKAHMDSLIATYYAGGTRLDAVACFSDAVALGVTDSLTAAGVDKLPIIIGQDCDIPNIKNIIAGKQTMSIIKDTTTPVDFTVSMVQDILNGVQPEINDTTTFNNHVMTVPSFLCCPAMVDANNYKFMLIDNGLYTEDQFK
jgi:putative multiple sugar transport system substrate-binding protein